MKDSQKSATQPIPASIFIDGENILYSLLSVLIPAKLVADRAGLVKFDLISLFVEATKANIRPINIYYYGTKPHLVKDMGDDALEASKKMMEHKLVWDKWLEEQKITFITAGNLKARLKREGVVFQEKGVDVRLAVDMVQLSYEKQKMHFVIASSDSDIIPALRVVAQRGHTITYVAMSGSINKAVAANVDNTITYNRRDIISAYNSVNEAKS